MQMTGNTILITGGGSGIGRGLAEVFQQRGNRVVIAGRREDVLRDTAAANPGMEYALLDVTDPASIRDAARELPRRFPALNVVINNAGVQRVHDFSVDAPLDEAALAAEIDTNVLGLIRMCSTFAPHLRTRPDAALVNISSGLAFVPLARFPVYCATKAAVHSFTLSLRQQLRDSGVQVIELAPPYVATELDRHHKHEVGANRPMPLAEFIDAAMQEFATGGDELAVGTAKFGMAAAMNDNIRQIFARMNG